MSKTRCYQRCEHPGELGRGAWKGQMPGRKRAAGKGGRGGRSDRCRYVWASDVGLGANVTAEGSSVPH
eukprot:1195255-Prorocentrum_minimum.AAC.3